MLIYLFFSFICFVFLSLSLLISFHLFSSLFIFVITNHLFSFTSRMTSLPRGSSTLQILHSSRKYISSPMPPFLPLHFFSFDLYFHIIFYYFYTTSFTCTIFILFSFSFLFLSFIYSFWYTRATQAKVKNQALTFSGQIQRSLL